MIGFGVMRPNNRECPRPTTQTMNERPTNDPNCVGQRNTPDGWSTLLLMRSGYAT